MKVNLEKYDKYVWRINGTLLLLACLGAILVCTIVGYKLLSEVFGERQVHDIVNVDQNTKKEEFLRLGYFQNLKGTDYILVPLTSEQKIDSSYYSKSAHNRAKNYLVFNTLNKESYWIWKNNSNLVLEHSQIYNQSQNDKTQQTKGLVFEFVEKDSNSDSLLTDNDVKSVEYFDLTTKKTIQVINDVDRSIGVQQVSDNEVLFFYSRSGKSYFKSLSVSSLSLSTEKEIGLPF